MGRGENRFKNIWNEVFRWSSNRSLALVWCITSLLPYSTYLSLVFQDCQVFSLTQKTWHLIGPTISIILARPNLLHEFV